MTIPELYKVFLTAKNVVTDSRKVEPGDLFFALKGENFDGNKFAGEVINNGAIAAVVDDPQYVTAPNCILTDDALKTLQQLANYHRSQLQTRIIGITGTNGKTTTKELISAVLKTTYNTFSTKGNFNNHIGVPLSLLSIESGTELAVIEMGANHIGEIAFLCEVAQPDFGIITNVGKAHLEGFGGPEGVKKAKGELFDVFLGCKL
jgi:UDP-N-acetylmuramoyl-tripeptide--D-alanyl-D-alanine ligase